MRSESSEGLKRNLGLFALIAYGIGDILGAGIYALIGKVAGLAGNGCWLAFVFSFVVALLTGLSYAELGSRYPRSAGASLYSLKAFNQPLLSYFVGFLVLMSGAVSMATVSHAFAGYFRVVLPEIPTWTVILLFLGALTVINFWGIHESSLTNIVCTMVEISGILIVIAAGLKGFGKVNYFEMAPPGREISSHAFFQAGILAFYAFVGFEDIANVAEETHEPAKSMPRAILASLGVVAIFYILTALAAVSIVPPSELAASSAPLMLVVEKAFPWIPRSLFTLIALFAVTNTALVNFIMGSRLLYGMAKEGLVPLWIARVHPKRHTPYRAIGLVLLIAIALALTGTLVVLAQSNSLILLIVFSIMNLSLMAIKLRANQPSSVSFQIPILIPLLGALSCFFLIFHVASRAWVTVLFLLFLGLLFYVLVPAQNLRENRL